MIFKTLLPSPLNLLCVFRPNAPLSTVYLECLTGVIPFPVPPPLLHPSLSAVGTPDHLQASMELVKYHHQFPELSTPVHLGHSYDSDQ